ncbi:MAG: procyclic acidic repetitive family protein [Candidatus Methanoplasma sp.]|nr:procyclic acidic repetitive family protein [Candidatus Methanoplasma sp.]
MGNALENGKITGAFGIATAVILFVVLAISVLTTKDFVLGTNPIGDLFSEDIFVYGLILVGILGVVFGALVSLSSPGPKTFIGRVRGVLIVISGILLVVLSYTEKEGSFENYHILWIFIAVILLAALASAAYNWVVDQKLQLVIIAVLFVILAATGYLTIQGENNIGGPAFAAFIAIWVLIEGVLFLAPVEAEAPKAKAKEKPKKKAEPAKKNGPAPRPYPAKTETPKKKEEPKKEEPKKKEAPKKEEPKKVEVPKEEPKKEEPKKETPKLKVMSSKNAAAARDAAKKETPVPEPVKEEPVSVPEPVSAPEPIPEPVPEPVKEEPIPVPEPVSVPEPVPEPVKEEPIPVPEPESDEEDTEDVEDYGDFEIAEDTPDALVRRATWNKGLRCRRDYGEHQIPIAFVKGRVAVYVVPEIGDTSGDEKLREEGWTVLRYLESDITDGKDQGEEIHKAVKDNAKADRAKKKKPAKK